MARWALVTALFAYLALFGFNSLTRIRAFTPDGMNYVDVARNIAAGRGISESAVRYAGDHFESGGGPAAPLTAQPPLYPLVVALLCCSGVPCADAALLVSVVGYAIVLWLGYRLARETFGERAALLASALLLVYAPLRMACYSAWSEALGVALLLACLGLLARGQRVGASRSMVVLAGLAAGLACATRFALGMLLPIGAGFLLATPRLRRTVSFFLVGFLLPAGAVLLRNWFVSGSMLPGTSPSDRGLVPNLHDVLLSLTVRPSRLLPPVIDTALAGALVIAVLALLLRSRADLRALVLDGPRGLLSLWSFGYLAWIVALRSSVHFNTLNQRLVLPASVTLLVLFAGLLAEVVRAGPQALRKVLLIVTLLAIGRETQTALGEPAPRTEERLARSQRLTWVASHTTARDLVVGDDTLDIPFLFGPRDAITFATYPYTERVEYAKLQAYLDRHCARYEHIYLVLRRRFESEDDWRRGYGQVIADLALGRAQAWPGARPLATLDDGTVFELPCPRDSPVAVEE